MNKVQPKKIRFIKLGEGGKWEAECIKDGTLRLGYDSGHHAESLRGEWDVVRDFWLKVRNQDKGSASRDINQIKDFYEAPEEDVWITFHGKHLYWCRADREVVELPDRSRVRRAIGGWSNKDGKGAELRIEKLDGRVSKVRGYRGTICAVEQQAYLVRKINGEVQPDVAAATGALKELRGHAATLIRSLDWKDFELLVDLVFSRAGWQRFSVVGSTEKDTDLDLVAPLSDRRAFVQVKSRTDRNQVLEYIARWQAAGHDEFYMVYHSASEDLDDLQHQSRGIFLMDVNKLAERVVMAGLMQWLIDKRS